MSDTPARDRWHEDRTTFQRVYDLVLGTREFLTAREVADRADCSESGAREALEQLVEMDVARRRDGRPATYRRNDAYLTWKRVESLARDHDPETLRARVEELIEEDEAFQQQFGVPGPDAVTSADLPADDHEALHEAREDLNEWRTVRQDVGVLRRALHRAEARLEDGIRP